MEDAIKSIKAYLYDRESSPLTGAYLISWCIWNFKFILIVFSSDPIHIKFLNIENYLFEPSYFIDYSQWLGPIWVYATPLLLALLYLIALPKFSRKIYEISLDNRKELNKIKQKFEDQELLTIEESIKIRREAYKASEQYEHELQRKNETIANLRAQIEAARKLNASTNVKKSEPSANEKLLRNLSEEGREILRLGLEDGNGELTCIDDGDEYSVSGKTKSIIPNDIRQSAKLKKAITELELSALISDLDGSGQMYDLTELGTSIAKLIAQPSAK